MEPPNDPVSWPLEPTDDVLRGLLAAVTERLVEFLRALPDRPAQATEGGAALADRLREPLPEGGASFDDVLATVFDEVVPCAFDTAGPGYLAYVPGGGLVTAAVADLIASTVNRYAGVWAAAPAVVQIETQALRWLADLMGFGPEAGGLITTGGSLSTLSALVAAREDRLGEDLGRGVVYASEEVHHCLAKAVRIAGLPSRHLRSLPVDRWYRLEVAALREQVAKDRADGLLPFFVCASAGTTNTGAVDPLGAIADLCEAEGLWFHVDGAYGAVFRALDELRPLFEGMERADSLTVDPHKGLFLPYGTGALIVKDPATLRRAFETSASYMPDFQDDPRHVDYCEISPELSRDWRGLRLWLPFKLHGFGAFRAALAEKRQLALRAHERLAARADVEIVAPPELSLFAFRQRFSGQDLANENRRNRELLARINAYRRVMMTGTETGGVFFLRVCVLHLRTHRERLDEGLDIIERELGAARP